MSALTDRDVNAQPTSNPTTTEKRASAGEDASKEPQQNKQLFQHIAQNNAYAALAFKSPWRITTANKSYSKPGQSYISPSDAILSPASKKLSDFKQKQINKQ